MSSYLTYDEIAAKLTYLTKEVKKLWLAVSTGFGGTGSLSGFTTDDLDEGDDNLYFPGFTSLLADYSFTDNSSDWNTAYGWGDHSIEGYITAETDPVFTSSTAFSITPTNVSNWNTAFSWGNHTSAGYLTAETDPVFVASDVYGVTSTDISNWNDAFSWGDHSLIGYLTAETDPVFTGSAAYGITSTQISNWDTSFGWGNHASAGYLTAETDPVFVASDAYAVTSTGISNWNTAYGWGDHSLEGYLTALPSHTLADHSDVSGWSTSDPLVNGTAAQGTAERVSREDHVHPSDTSKADDTAVVKLSGDQSVSGTKTFGSFPVTPSSAPTTDYQVANKKYVDDNAGGMTLYVGQDIREMTVYKAISSSFPWFCLSLPSQTLSTSNYSTAFITEMRARKLTYDELGTPVTAFGGTWATDTPSAGYATFTSDSSTETDAMIEYLVEDYLVAGSYSNFRIVNDGTNDFEITALSVSAGTIVVDSSSNTPSGTSVSIYLNRIYGSTTSIRHHTEAGLAVYQGNNTKLSGLRRLDQLQDLTGTLGFTENSSNSAYFARVGDITSGIFSVTSRTGKSGLDTDSGTSTIYDYQADFDAANVARTGDETRVSSATTYRYLYVGSYSA